MADAGTTLMHATAIACGGTAALIVGPSGAGKSDLALRAITLPVRGAGGTLAAMLLADDQVELAREGGVLMARPPATIAGRLEVRGIGILTFPHIAIARVGLVASLDPDRPRERLPEPVPHASILGLDIPMIALDPREATAHIKLMLALQHLAPPVP